MRHRIIIVLLICVICPLLASAQKKFQPEWNVGVGGGMTMSSVDFDPSLDTKNLTGFQGGIAVRYISEKHLGFVAELNYSQQGWEQNFKDNPELKHTHTLNYIELPFLTHIYFGNKVRFFVNLGPKVGFLLSESEEVNDDLKHFLASGNATSGHVTHQYYRTAEKKIDYGILGGGGLEYSSGIGKFALEGRYYFGLGDIYNNNKSDYFARSANRVISIKLTYYTKLF